MADVSKQRDLRSSASHPDISVTERPSDGGKDPLAELARLIGKDDLFEQMRRDADRAEKEPAAEAYDPLRAAPMDLDGDALRGTYDPGVAEPAAYAAATEAAPESAPYGHGYRSAQRYAPAEPEHAAGAYDAYAGQPAAQTDPAAYYADPAHDPRAGAYEGEYYDPAAEAYDDQVYEEPQPERRRTGLKIFAAVAGLAVIGAAGAYGYRALSGGDGGQPPVIKASVTPAKVAPAQQGAPPAARTTYDRADRSQPARVVSSEEQPVELREARTAAPRMPVPAASGGPSMVGAPNAPAASLALPAGVSTGLADTSEPKKVKTIAIRPDGTPVSASGAARSSAPRTAAPPMALGPQGQGAAAAPTRTASIPARAAAGGSHVVQVSSQKSEEDAQASFRSLQAKYPNVLGGRQPLIRRTDLGERGIFYRVQVGPFSSADQANELCGSLKAAGGQCIVQRN